MNIFPQEPGDWIALLAALTPVVIWAGSGAATAWTAGKKQRAEQWRRLQELALILYNPEHTYGRWAQTLALEEMIELRRVHPEASGVLKEALTYWLKTAMHDETGRDLVKRLQGEFDRIA